MSAPHLLYSQTIPWKELDQGLHFAEVDAPVKSTVGDSKIRLLKIDPEHYTFHLLSAKELKTNNRTAKAWATSQNMIATINAGMYQQDHQTNVGYMKNFDVVNSPHINQNNTIVAFNPKNKELPAFQIIDRKCQDWETLKNQYHTLIQGIRMMDCHQKNRWSQQPKKWSMVVIGKDKDGHALFIHCRSPYSVHDFINMLKKIHLNLYNAMYLEGGPEASFYLNHSIAEMEQFGSYETGFWENDNNDRPWPLPNVIGIRSKD